MFPAFEEKQIGDLLNDFERVRDAARPERVPDLINLTANFTGKHRFFRGKELRILT
jgi:hypothetical protein